MFAAVEIVFWGEGGGGGLTVGRITEGICSPIHPTGLGGKMPNEASVIPGASNCLGHAFRYQQLKLDPEAKR